MVQVLLAPRRTTREAIIDAAIYVLAQNPGASLSEVAVRAGVGRATLHRHFPSRAELMRELTLASIREIEEAVAPIRGRAESHAEDLLKRLEVIVPLGDRFHYLWSESGQLADDPEVTAGHQSEIESLNTLVEGLKEEGALASDVPTEWASAVIDSLVWIAWSSVQAGTVGHKQAAKLAHRTLIQGLSA